MSRLRVTHLRPLLGTLLLLVLPGSLAAEPGAVQLQLEVNIPERTVMHFTATSGSAAERMATDAEGIVFDLACARPGTVTESCLALYGGALLDTEGRPYPPVNLDAAGRFTAVGNFPQYFQSASRNLRFFTSADSWQLQVEFIGETVITADHFAIHTDRAGWHCLGYHSDWLDPVVGAAAGVTCSAGTDASRNPVLVASSDTTSHGWQELAVQLMLRIDGSEPAGSYSSVLRYTLASL